MPAQLHQRQVVGGAAGGDVLRRQPGGVQVVLRPQNIVRKDEQRCAGAGVPQGAAAAGVVAGGAHLQRGVLRVLVVPPADVQAHRRRLGQNGRGQVRVGRGGGPQLGADGVPEIGKIGLALKIAPGQQVQRMAAGTAAAGDVAVGDKVQPQPVEPRRGLGLKAVPVAGHHAAGLFAADHQGFQRVLQRQMPFGVALPRCDPDLRRQAQRAQRADGVGGRAALPVLPVDQDQPLAAAQRKRPGKGVDEHLVAQPAGQFGIDHGAASFWASGLALGARRSYSACIRRAASPSS